MTAPRFVSCKCTHPHAAHTTDGHEGDCAAPECVCAEYVPSTLTKLEERPVLVQASPIPTSSIDCECGHGRLLHPERLDFECRVQTCDCEQYRTTNAPAVGAAGSATPAPAPAPSQGAGAARVTSVASSAPTAEQLIAAGKRSGTKRVKGMAERIESLLGDLAGLVREERATAEAKRRQEAEAEKARAAVAELEAQLAEAKAKLKGTASRTPPASTSAGTATCPDCGKTGFSNVGVHRAKAHGYRAAS